jgi:MFS transporter, MHS family, proline/betaine transporter
MNQYPFKVYFAFFTGFLPVTTGYYFYLYIPMHAIQYAELSRAFMMSSTICSLVFVTALIPFFLVGFPTNAIGYPFS